MCSGCYFSLVDSPFSSIWPEFLMLDFVKFVFNLQHIKFISKRKGGNKNLPHKEWCQTVQTEPDVISMSFVPITSLLSGINGSGFLTHAINLYIRCKHGISSQFACWCSACCGVEIVIVHIHCVSMGCLPKKMLSKAERELLFI